jgi:hypothetical protein
LCIFPFLVCSTKKNLATLAVGSCSAGVESRVYWIGCSSSPNVKIQLVEKMILICRGVRSIVPLLQLQLQR